MTLLMLGVFQNLNVPGVTLCNPSLKIHFPLDYSFLSESMSPSVVQIKVVPNIFSDHSAICLTLSCGDKEIKHGPEFWKFNNSLLTDRHYMDMITEQIPQFTAKCGNLTDKALF